MEEKKCGEWTDKDVSMIEQPKRIICWKMALCGALPKQSVLAWSVWAFDEVEGKSSSVGDIQKRVDAPLFY